VNMVSSSPSPSVTPLIVGCGFWAVLLDPILPWATGLPWKGSLWMQALDSWPCTSGAEAPSDAPSGQAPEL
jgi:hypothetical protein